ncbi:MAG: RsmE family RNA methyltransferase [Elusimicrobia bacterium]|nr:RsmE family RNA methyltransferase [Elusimicrobiota bacterium]
MPQFFLPPQALKEKTFRLTGPEAFHITKVLRYQPGQSLVLFDGKGGRFEAVIQAIEKDGSVSGALTGTLHGTEERKPAEIRLYQGLLKASHWDWVLEKGTELGVAAFIPVTTPRTVVLLHEAERVKAKAERWGRVVMAAAKQCGRADLPEVLEPVQFRDSVKACLRQPEDEAAPKTRSLTLLAWEGLNGATACETIRLSLREADQSRGAEKITVNLFIGPEGGFTEEEVELAESLDAVIFGLGPRTLRAETAAVAAVSLIQYEFGSL